MAPVELLKIAGVNLETPAPIQDALNAFGEIIKEMETLAEDQTIEQTKKLQP